MAKIKKIKLRENGVYGEAINLGADAVNIDLLDGTNVEESLLNVVYHEDSTEVENIELGYEHQENKTQIVDSNSTEAQYPSAKAVYDAILANKELGLVIEVVDELPGDTDVINELAIYLTPNGEDQGENIYNEYVRINGKWEFIGTTKVDLSNYATKDELIPWLTAVPNSIDDLELGIYRIDTLSIEGNAATFPVTNGAINLHTMFNGCNCVYLYVSQDSEEGKTATLQGTSNINDTITPKIVTCYSGGSDRVLYENQADEKYAKLSLYNDTTINIGRKADTEVGENSAAIGYLVTASGEYSYAEGKSTISSGSSSHAEGFATTASGSHSHAEGAGTVASGGISHAEGWNTIASGHYSHAEGENTQALSPHQHVQGKYNIADSNETYAHIVGNGATETQSSNAHTLTWTGEAWYQGDVYVGSTSGRNKDEGSKKLATEEYVNTLVSESKIYKASFTNETSEEDRIAIMQEVYSAHLEGKTVEVEYYDGYQTIQYYYSNIVENSFIMQSPKIELTDFESRVHFITRNIISAEINEDVVVSVYESTNILPVLSTESDYQNPYVPLYDGSPATKKYVDDSITAAITAAIEEAY